jgi:site-specific recombinase
MTQSIMTRVVEHGDASEIPAARWFWRRWYVFALTTAIVGLLVWLTREVQDVITLRMTIRYLCWTLLALVFVYVAGATATDCVNMVSSLRTTRREMVTTGTAIPSQSEGELPENQRVNL